MKFRLSQKSQLKGSVHTNAFSKVCVFFVIENASIDSRPHYRLMRFRQSTKKRSKMIKLQAVTYIELYAHATNTHACNNCGHRFRFVLLRFRPSTLTRFVCVFVLIHSQGRFQIDAFSMKTSCVLVWTEGLNPLKCISLRKQPFQGRRARRNGCFCRPKCIRSRENKGQELYPLLMRFQTKTH